MLRKVQSVTMEDPTQMYSQLDTKDNVSQPRGWKDCNKPRKKTHREANDCFEGISASPKA